MLPQLKVPTYTLNLPSSGKQITYRPFTVKEEKILLMAVDDDEETQIRALRQVIQNCIITGNIDVAKMPVFDIDYVWLKIRSKSVEEIAVIPFVCQNKLPNGTTIQDHNGETRDYCGNVVQCPVNLDEIEVTKNPENNPKITLQDGIGIILRYPTFENFQKLNTVLETNDIEESFNIIIDCVEMIYDAAGKCYEREFMDVKELREFLESLSETQFAKIMKFFDTIPAIRHKIHFKCPKCKYEVDIVVEGTRSFLALDSAMKP